MDETVMVRVEVPKGTRNKYEWDEERQALVFDRRLFAAVTFPTDYGEILDTLAEDGDPIDAIMCISESTFPGCLVQAKPIGVLLAVDSSDGDRDDKVLCVPDSDPAWADLDSVGDLPQNLADEIWHFFTIYGDFQNKKLELERWGTSDDALNLIREGQERFREREG